MPAMDSGRWHDIEAGGDGDRARACGCLLGNEEDKQRAGNDGWQLTATVAG